MPIATFMFNVTSGTTYGNWYRLFKFNGAKSVSVLISIARGASSGSPLNSITEYTGTPTTETATADFRCISCSQTYSTTTDQITFLRISKDSSSNYYIDGYLTGTANAANSYVVTISSLTCANTSTLFTDLFTPASSLAVSTDTAIQSCLLHGAAIKRLGSYVNYDFHSGDYKTVVIPLVRLSASNSSSADVFYGRIYLVRPNFSTTESETDMIECIVGDAYYGNYVMRGDFIQKHDASNNVQLTPCTFVYNSKHYGGIEVKAKSTSCRIIIEGCFGQRDTQLNFVDLIQYEDHTGGTSTILNSEIANSIGYDNTYVQHSAIHNPIIQYNKLQLAFRKDFVLDFGAGNKLTDGSWLISPYTISHCYACATIAPSYNGAWLYATMYFSNGTDGFPKTARITDLCKFVNAKCAPRGNGARLFLYHTCGNDNATGGGFSCTADIPLFLYPTIDYTFIYVDPQYGVYNDHALIGNTQSGNIKCICISFLVPVLIRDTTWHTDEDEY